MGKVPVCFPCTWALPILSPTTPPPPQENPRVWEEKCILTSMSVCAYKGLKNHQISNRKHIFAMLFNAA